MNRHVAEQELVQLLDGELPARRLEAVQAHLAVCAQCRAERDALAQASAGVRSVLQGVAELPPADRGRAMLRARMAEETIAAPAGGWWPRWSWIFASAALTLAATGWLLLPRPLRHLETHAVPDPALTPGATIPVTREEICAIDAEETTRPVPPQVAHAVFAAYGIEAPPPRAYEVDYLITPALGGSDSVRNFWPQSYRDSMWNAHTKDALEDRLHALVCAGDLDLATAQDDIARDWIGAYKKYFRTSVPLPEHARFLKDRPWE